MNQRKPSPQNLRALVVGLGLLSASALVACDEELPPGADGSVPTDGGTLPGDSPKPDSSVPPLTPFPDLVISSVELTPAEPIQGQPVRVVVELRNDGAASPTANVPVEWRGGDGFRDASCSWSIAAARVAPGAAVFMACDFTYVSWYAAITHVAVADPQGLINEGASAAKANNTLKTPIAVAKP